ncbi:hypothetical protein R80B4_02518 [Fibrobacteres bacterium R8-0-B4]
MVVAAAVAVGVLGLSGCGDNGTAPAAGGVVISTFVDGRDGTTYKKVKIGGQTWMAENLNYNTAESWCYDNSPDSCAKYGRLYTWSAANTACPTGWHLPSRAEWGDLAKAASGTGDYGASGTAGKKLKSTSGWVYSDGTDDFGFSALPGGVRSGYEDSFHWAESGYWWTATELDGDLAYDRFILNSYHDVRVGEDSSVKRNGYSVRCVAD